MNLAVSHPWLLLGLALGVLPLLGHPLRPVTRPWLSLVPRDQASRWVDWMLRITGAALVVALVLGLAGVHQPQSHVERIGRGAHVVLLVDRSRSMDQPFGRGYQRAAVGVSHGNALSKGRVARDLLAEFVGQRENDLFGLVVFSTFPIPVLELTANHDIVQAAIKAGNLGRGLAETNIGAGLERALAFFENTPYTGSRIVLLVSDGAAELSTSTRLRIINLMNRLRVSLYWIYIRSAHGPHLIDDTALDRAPNIAPERLLHAFFSDMGAPYKAYTADSPQALELAIRDVASLQNLPLRYQAMVPRRDLSAICYLFASILLSLLIIAKLLEVKRW